MVATFVGADNDSAELHNTSRQATKVAGATLGVIWLTFWTGNSEDPETGGITAPSGWVQRGTVVNAAANERTYCYLKHCGADPDATNYDFSWTPAAWNALQSVWFSGDFTGVDLSTVPFDSATGTDTSVAATSVTTAAGAALAWSCNTADYGGTTTHTPPTGFTETDDVDQGAVAYRIATGASESASGATVSPSVGFIAALIAVPEAAAGVTGDLAATLPALTGEFTGDVTVAGTLAGTLPILTADLAGTVGTDVVGTLDATLPALTAELVGELTVTGTLDATLPALTAAITGTSDATGGPFVTGVSSNGRYFVDANGDPLLVRADSPWAMFTKLSPTEMDTYLANRASYGTNLVLVSMIGAVANGAPSDDGATYDGILPFVGGDPTQFNETYWSRMDSFIAKARAAGIGLQIYPMDGWNTTFGSTVFNAGSVTQGQCQTYGQTLATRYAGEPHIIWSFGGDYNEDATINGLFDACLQGIRAAGNTALCTIQLLYETSESHNSTFWETRVDWDFVYTYYVTYKGVSDSYNHTWSQSPTVRPALFSEGAYENSFEPHPGTDEVIRRQACWALTSGSPGDFTGAEGVWNFQASWETALDTTAATQLQAIRDTFEGIAWWTLVPDDANQLVTGGRGTRITTDTATYPADNDYVTAARSADASLAVIYLPNAASAITVDTAQIGANPTATWVDPTSGATVATTPTTSYSRTANAAGNSDWLLILTGDPVTITGTLAGTLPALTADLTGDITVTGALDTDLPAFEGVLAGQLTITGAVAADLPALTGSLAGVSGDVVNLYLPTLVTAIPDLTTVTAYGDPTTATSLPTLTTSTEVPNLTTTTKME